MLNVLAYMLSCACKSCVVAIIIQAVQYSDTVLRNEQPFIQYNVEKIDSTNTIFLPFSNCLSWTSLMCRIIWVSPLYMCNCLVDVCLWSVCRQDALANWCTAVGLADSLNANLKPQLLRVQLSMQGNYIDCNCYSGFYIV